MSSFFKKLFEKLFKRDDGVVGVLIPITRIIKYLRRRK